MKNANEFSNGDDPKDVDKDSKEYKNGREKKYLNLKKTAEKRSKNCKIASFDA